MTNSLKLIENFYRDKRAERTKIPLINHIYEGLEIMSSLEASELGKSAYCIHPMLQDTSALIENINYCFDNFPERKICSIFVPIYLLPLL